MARLERRQAAPLKNCRKKLAGSRTVDVNAPLRRPVRLLLEQMFLH